jgi:uncharacterized protein (TIGR02147 family)
MMNRTNLNIFEFTDYRQFLSARLTELRRQNRRYSLRFLSDKMGLSSKSHLKMVADGQRNISLDMADKLADAIGLTDEEGAFFICLVRYNLAKTTAEQLTALDDLRRKRKFIDVHRLELDHFDYLSDPMTVTLREMVSFPDFQEDPKWIAARLPMKANATRIQKALDNLIRLGMIKRDDDGRLRLSHRHQRSGDGLKSVGLRTFYENTFRQAAESLRKSADERHLGGLTMGISRKSYERIVQRYRDFISDVRAIVDDDSEADQVYQMVMGLFPLSVSGSELQVTKGDGP